MDKIEIQKTQLDQNPPTGQASKNDQLIGESVVPKISKKIVGVIVVLLLIIGGVAILVFQNNKSNSLQATQGKTQSTIPTEAKVENIPFYEMTIPSLRGRKYESRLGKMEEISNNGVYTSYLTSYESDGLTVNGLLTRPNGVKPSGGFPAIVFIHGYIPPTLYVTTEKYNDYVDYLARNGFVVFKIDLRGHGESDGEPGGGYYGSDYVVDSLNASAALASSDFVKPSAIGFWGHSMAGNAVMRVMAARPETPAGVIWAGAVYTYLDLRKYGINDNSYRPPANDAQRQNRRRELFEKHGSPSAQSTFWQQVAPTKYLSDLKGAVEIHHAVDDDVVDIGYSRDLDILLDEANVTHELHEYDSGGHNLSGRSFAIAMQTTVEFYKEHLK